MLWARMTWSTNRGPSLTTTSWAAIRHWLMRSSGLAEQHRYRGFTRWDGWPARRERRSGQPKQTRFHRRCVPTTAMATASTRSSFTPHGMPFSNIAISNGLHAAPWASVEPAAHVTRAAGFLVWSQAESGHGCPVSMTYAAVPALRADTLTSPRDGSRSSRPRRYDPGLRAPAKKAGLLAGMAMTEKQGGSDLRANSTRAQRTADDTYLLTGHKWFTSAPMNDIFLVLAQAPDGLSCFIVPRVT